MKNPATIMGKTVIATCHSKASMSNYAQLADGNIIKQMVGDKWKVWKKWKPTVAPESYAQRFADNAFKPGRMEIGLIEHPTLKQLEHWEFDGVSEATDGCQVEPDGTCPHGCKSWNLYFA